MYFLLFLFLFMFTALGMEVFADFEVRLSTSRHTSITRRPPCQTTCPVTSACSALALQVSTTLLHAGFHSD